MFREDPVDTLSATLMRMRLKNSAAGAIDGRGSWAVRIPAYGGFKLHLLVKGEAWVSIEGDPQPHYIHAGDCILMTSGKPTLIAKAPAPRKIVKIESLLTRARNGVMTLNGGGEFFSIGIHFEFEGHLPKLLFAGLPSLIRIPGHLEQAALLRWSAERFQMEYAGQNIGRSLVLNHLAPVILLQILRIYLASAKSEKNWLVALSDPKLSKAIDGMHSDYRRAWSLENLAALAGMSRSGFALNFRKQVGVPPMDYLAHWRMQIACELLKSPAHNVATVADAVGYESESAFSAAFTKIMNCRPGFYQRNHELKLA